MQVDLNDPRSVTFAGNVPDSIIIDGKQADLFGALGQARSLFHSVATWPCLQDLYAPTNKPVYDQNSDVGCAGHSDPGRSEPADAGQTVQQAAETVGGVLWTDPSGSAWAIRLLPAANRPSEYVGFAIGIDGGGVHRSADGRVPPESRQFLQSRVSELRLGPRARSALYLIHIAALQQRSSVVLLPDIQFAQIFWGGSREDWPADWRRDVLSTLLSLTHLRSAVVRLGRIWRPHFAAHSVALAHVEQLSLTRPEEDVCRPACPAWHSGQRHTHFLVQVGLGFFGVLEQFCSRETKGIRQYDFAHRPQADHDELKDAIKTGQIVTMSGPAAVFGGLAGTLTARQLSVLQAVRRELTRVRQRTSRPDKAQVMVGNLVPGRSPGAKISCPLLNSSSRYIAFGGNGMRPGMGYGVIGVTNSGWLAKCGYEIPDSAMELLRTVRRFLRDLEVVGEVMGLTIVGLDVHTLEWYSLGDLLLMSRRRQELDRIDSVQLRLYGPENYAERCRMYFAQAGGFAAIPGDPAGEEAKDEPIGTDNFSLWLGRLKITQAEASAAVGITQPFLNQLLNHARHCPEDVGQRLRQYIARERDRRLASETTGHCL